MACSSPNSPDIEATVEAKVQERAVDATVEARVKESVVERVNNPPPNPDLAKDYSNRARGHFEAGDLQLAINDYTKAIQLGLTDRLLAEAYLGRGAAYGNLTPRQTQKAIDDTTKAIRIDPQNAKAYNNRGIGYRNLREYALADADKSMACSLDTKYC